MPLDSGQAEHGRPWLARYAPGVPADLRPGVDSPLEHFRSWAAQAPEAPCLITPDRVLDTGTVEALTSTLAAALAARGVGPGDRVAVMLQNTPQVVLTQLAAWKLGAIVVPVNPMLREREVTDQLQDAGVRAMVVLDELFERVAPALAAAAVEVVLTTPERLVPAAAPAGADDLMSAIEAQPTPARMGPELRASDVAYLTYTSGTTGPPKGAMNTHGNVTFGAEVYRTWARLGPEDVVLAAAPLFHITGLVAGVATALAARAPLVLAGRFEPATVLQQMARHRCTFTVASITAFLALASHPEIERTDLSALRKVYSGGAPIPPATVARFEGLTGAYIHNVYGLTETTSPALAVPLGVRAPVDPDTGALSLGVPVPSTLVRVVSLDTGQDVGPGEIGELWTKGPQVVSGYWQRPEVSAAAIIDGYLRTGDVGKMDADGWFYLVDRAKDLIIASGYKVWPREVEDVLYEHPAVREAAVVGVPHPYRGETVKAVVSMVPGATAAPEELIAFCRERMAAYKYPRVVEVVDEVPKTATGKFLRRALRGREA